MINTDLLSIGSTFMLGMANHLRQLTLFAAAAWLITIFLKKTRFPTDQTGKRISNTVQLAFTRDMIEPDVFGVFHPV